MLAKLLSRRPLCWRRKCLSIRSCCFYLICALSIWLIFCWLNWLNGAPEVRQQRSFAEFRWPLLDQLDLRKGSQPPPLNPWSSFVPLTLPSCSYDHLPTTKDKFVLIVVRSAPHRLEWRNAIRKSWGANGVQQQPAGGDGIHFLTVFVLGRSKEDSNKKLLEEVDGHGDLLIGDFVDDYRNATLKLIHAIGLAINYCGSPMPVPYLFVVDDNLLLFPWNLAKLIAQHQPAQKLFVGKAYQRGSSDVLPDRHRLSPKWVSLGEYPFDRYPDFVDGGAMLISGWTLSEFYLAIPYAKLYVWDDVWLGMIAHYIGTRPENNEHFLFSDHPSPWDKSWQQAVVVVRQHGGFSAANIRQLFAKMKTEEAERDKKEKEEERKRKKELKRMKMRLDDRAEEEEDSNT